MTTSSPRHDRQVVRVLGLLKTLTEGGHPTVYQLAARFKTRRETIYRDIHTLEAIGYPILGDESGRLSRPRLAPEARTTLPPVALSPRETAALIWAAKQVGARQPFATHLATALAKLQALTPSRDGRLALALESTVTGWERGAKDYSALERTILELVKAIVSRQRCRVEYTHRGARRLGAFRMIRTDCSPSEVASTASARCRRTRTWSRWRSSVSIP